MSTGRMKLGQMNPFQRYLDLSKWLSGPISTAAPLRLAKSLPMLQDATFVCSLGWILYRIWQIYQKPVDELVDLLGLDIPPIPEVSLAGITSESVLLYWKPAESLPPSLKHSIQVNGIKVGDFGRGDTSIQVTGLKPGHYYNIRVISTNTANFSSLGPLIRLRTLVSTFSEGIETDLSKVSDPDVTSQRTQNEPASIRATLSQFEPTISTLNYQIPKDPFGSPTNGRRTVSGRRNSPAASITDPPSGQSSCTASMDEDDSEEAIQRLTSKLDYLRREQQDTDKQINEDELEHRTSIADLSKERDRLKQLLKEKEENAAELRKHGNQIDKLNRSAQSRKAAKEKVLQQKRAERQKIKDDIARWSQEITAMRHYTEGMASRIVDVKSLGDSDVAEVRRAIAEDHTLIKSLEEEIRVKGIQIKSMERDTESLGANGDESLENAKFESDKDFAWETRTQSMQGQLAALWQIYQQAELENHQAQDRLSYWASRRSRDPGQFGAIPAIEYTAANRPGRLRRQRQLGSRSNLISLTSTNYQGLSMPLQPPFLNGSSQFSMNSPFFNMSNGMAVPSMAMPPPSEQTVQLQSDSDVLNGGGAMSPAANDLLPSNLFRDDDAAVREPPSILGRESSGDISQDTQSQNSNSQAEFSNADPLTPVSSGSQADSPSSSSHGSLQNLYNQQPSGELSAENDQLSINSTSAPFLPSAAAGSNPLAASRLAQFFPALNRQRGRSSTNESPALGTLKQGQSQSFPRNVEQDALDPLATRRRRGSYGNWALPMTALLNRNTTVSSRSSDAADLVTASRGVGRRNRLSMFSTKIDPTAASAFPERSSSRPSSTYSFEQIHGRPSSDSQKISGWSVPENIPNRSSPLGANWTNPGGPWSRGPSRRPSIQHGSTSNLSIGSTPLNPEVYDSTSAPQRSEQMPIGTRPRSSQRPLTPKLNPTAPTFKTIFGRGDARKAAKAEKASEKAAERARDKDIDKSDLEEVDSLQDGPSPSHPRLSRDAGSITTAASTADSRNSLDLSSSGTVPEAMTTLEPKETFMQKITRKSSSSKFNVPWSKERGSIFSKRAGETSAPGELDEDNSNEGPFGRSADNVASTLQQEKGSRSSLSWPNMRRKSKKGGVATEKSSEIIDHAET